MWWNAHRKIDVQREPQPAMESFHSTMDVATQSTILEPAPARQMTLDEVMAQLWIASNDTHYPSQPFRFKDLPRELRDIIYEHLVHREKVLLKVKEYNAMYIAVQDAPVYAMLNVGPEFSNEYIESTIRRSKLIGEDCGDRVPRKLDLPPDVSFKHIGSAEFKLMAICCCDDIGTEECNILDDIQSHRAWLTDLAPQLVDVQRVEISVLVSFSAGWKNVMHKGQKWPGDSDVLRESCEELGKLARDVLDLGVPIEKIKVFCHVRPENLRVYQARYHQVEFADGFGTWTRERGWIGGSEGPTNGSNAP
ncbi:hypothetical protein AC579_10547 [Pseudocercospora musae]|uniref:Uncharacterized protein n=1 Tax=Pseudocercospora musae TaxID=113226 RepID=A0A139IH90_9PEZI|nr:hypothetical protein AC579_10547 [Pseudocercospora musae]